MGVSRDTLEKIRNALNPLEIVKEAVPSLKASGQRWRGLCPFHNERTPSFFFMPEKGLWHCFGSCQEGGDVFKFIMKLENLTFPEALRRLADRAGIRLQWERSDGTLSRESQERERLLDLLDDAAKSYHDSLRKLAEAEPARRHLSGRKIRPETLEKFKLGFAPPRNGFLENALKRGVPIEDLIKAGLASRSDKSGRYHDPLWNRLIFPICDAYGRVVGFGGRTLEENGTGPKYINSPETLVYSKSRHLYGLFQGRDGLRKRGQAVVVEGYMDVVGCHQAGADNAVAPLGTAFTKEQAQLLKRYVQEVVLLYDPDEAGVRASWRSAQILLPADLFVRVAYLPGGLDPDEFVLKNGLASLEETLRQAQDVVDFWLDHIARTSQNFDSLHTRVRWGQELTAVLKGVPNEVLREEWLRKIARRLSLDEGALTRELDKQKAPTAARGAQPRNAPRASGKTGAPASTRRLPERVRSGEEEILQILCNAPDVWASMDPDKVVFTDLRCQTIFDRLKAQWKAHNALDVAAIAGDLNKEDGSWLSSLLLEEKTFENPLEALTHRLRDLGTMASERERRSLEKEVLQMAEGRIPRDETKLARYKELTRFLKGSARLETKVS